jgi:PKD repeat protein
METDRRMNYMDKKRKILCVVVCALMVANVLFLIAGTNDNGGDLDINEMPSEEEILKEIEETEDKTLEVDEIIGDRHVKYWEHVIDGICVKNDSILLHRDVETGEIVHYERCWTDVGSLSYPEIESIDPENYYWKKAVVFPDEDDCTYFYTFDDSQEYPLTCWEVRYNDGTTVMYDWDGNEIGQGIPAPANGYSLSGYDEEYSGHDPWLDWRVNANFWFSKWCSSTVSVSLPTPADISTYVSNADYKFFYELAHGAHDWFRADSQDSYYYPDSGAYNVQSDMAGRRRMKLAFIGSCEGMHSTGPGSFSHEFRKGHMDGTVTIGYHGMASCPGWDISLEWQNLMFFLMDSGNTMRDAFDLASAFYTTIAPCVVFVGDEDLVVGNNQPLPDANGPYLGQEGSPLMFDASESYDPDCNTLEYRWDFQSDGSWTGWSDSPYASHTYGDDWTGTATLEVREKYTSDQLTATTTAFVTIENVEPAVDSLPAVTINEGEAAIFSGHATDPGSDDLTFTWDWGHPSLGQSIHTYLNNPPNPDPYPSKDINPRDVTDSASKIYGDNGVFTVTLTVYDDDGGATERTATVTVNNVAPMVFPLPAVTIQEGQTVTFSGFASDPGSDDLTFTWNWGYAGFSDTVNTYLNNPPNPDPFPSPEVSPRNITDTASQTYGDNGVFTVTLTVADDDGGSTTVTTTVTVTNLAPTIENVEAYILIDFTLRAAGEKWHNVEMYILEDGTEIAFAEVVRYPGSPDDQSVTLYGVKCDVTKVIEVEVLYTPLDDPINGQINGATPCWVNLSFEDGGYNLTHHTFNVQHPETWEWTFEVNQYILGHEITFEADATDPGSDDLTFTWDWDDLTLDVTEYYNDVLNPDPYPSPDGIFPFAAFDTKGHTYWVSGTYNVELTVADDDGGVDVIVIVLILS